ncbi:MAG TPA: PaaI family thioesterase [Halobacteria archaeon]|jgi:uncharacterized protein (TIGR00369 family)|nr:PaaI family thioesterase [Halobacteria archaeon]
MSNKYLDFVKNDDQQVNRLFRFLGVKVVKISPDEVIISLPLSDDFTQGNGVTAGGIISTLMDEAMAHVVMANIGETTNIATIDMTVRFFKPVKGDKLTACATIKKPGRKIVFAHAVVMDGTVTVADADASFIILG